FVSGPENGVYIYLRALFGMCVTGVIGIAVSFFTQPKDDKEIIGLTIDTLDDCMKIYKGGEPNFELGDKLLKLKVSLNESLSLYKIQLSPKNMKTLKAKDGDLTYIADSRWFLGGLRSEHVKAFENKELQDNEVLMSTPTKDSAYLLDEKTVNVEKIF
ncbi:MAG: hypothetical protein WAU17_12135, partial [Nitrospirales bacterium]